MLAYLRLSPEVASERKYPEPPHPYRNGFQRDRDRIIHSRSFRRLEGKTQVFAPALSDHFPQPAHAHAGSSPDCADRFKRSWAQ